MWVRATSISQHIESISSAQKDYHGKHIRFVSSSSNDDENGDDSKNANLPSQNIASSDRVTSCRYPVEIEEMVWLRFVVVGQSVWVGSSFVSLSLSLSPFLISMVELC